MNIDNRLPAGALVRIDQGFGRFTEGIVEGFDADLVILGNRGFYRIRVHGGVNVFGKPAQVGAVRTVHHNHVGAQQ
jgi:hypothetical protein